jgi:hypothetical protein
MNDSQIRHAIQQKSVAASSRFFNLLRRSGGILDGSLQMRLAATRSRHLAKPQRPCLNIAQLGRVASEIEMVRNVRPKLSILPSTVLAAALLGTPAVAAEGLSPERQFARDIYQELIEINTVTATGDTAKAAEAMAARLRGGGVL